MEAMDEREVLATSNIPLETTWVFTAEATIEVVPGDELKEGE